MTVRERWPIRLAIGDLILTEVLQGLADGRDFNQAKKMLTSLIVVELCGREIAIQAAKNFRALRKAGVTVYELLHSDRDFDPFAKRLGLRVTV